MKLKTLEEMGQELERDTFAVKFGYPPPLPPPMPQFKSVIAFPDPATLEAVGVSDPMEMVVFETGQRVRQKDSSVHGTIKALDRKACTLTVHPDGNLPFDYVTEPCSKWKPLKLSDMEREGYCMGCTPDEVLVDYLMRHRHMTEMTLTANDYRLLVMSVGNAWGGPRFEVFNGGVKFAGPVGRVTIRPGPQED